MGDIERLVVPAVRTASLRLLERGTLRSAVLVLVCLVSAPLPTAAQRPAAREVSEAQRAARCFERFARGDELPPVPPARGEAARVTAFVQTLDEAEHPGSEARRRLAHCLPDGLRLEARLHPTQAEWLSRCFHAASDVLGRARGSELVSARFERDACGVVARAFAQWDPDALSALTAARPRAHPEVSTQTVAPLRSIAVRQAAIIDAIDAVSGALAACRVAHGSGSVRLVAQSGAAWAVRAWSEDGAQTVLTACVATAVRGATLPQGEPDSVAIDVRLVEPAAAESPRP